MKIFLALIFLGTLSSAQTPVVILGGTMIDGTGKVVENSAIVIRGTKIVDSGPKNRVRVPLEATIIDATGKYIIPGLIDCHVHYEKPRDLVQMLAWGVTSVNCMFESTDQALEMEKMTANDTIHSPQVYGTAPIFSCKGGWWEGDGFPIDSSINRFPETPDDARAAVRKAKEKGIKRIKLMYDDMGWCRDPLPRLAKMKKEVMRALIDEAQKGGLIAEVHAPTLHDAKEVLESNRVTLAHGVIDESFGPYQVVIFNFDARTSGLYMSGYYIPTFCVFEFLADTKAFMHHALDDQRFMAALPEDILHQYTSDEYYQRYAQRYPNISFVKAHLGTLDSNLINVDKNQIALGTDMWALPGIAIHLELEYMASAGLKPADVLVAAANNAANFLGKGRGKVPKPGRTAKVSDSSTQKPARKYTQGEIGTLDSGKQADFLILDANPLEDIRNTRSLRTIIKHGKVFDHQQLVEESKKMN